ncbi:hypothetical protein GYH30_009958 [Glycine max]|uniref:Uncharacterized protein n=2 Tax=Glycine subgen. Soja TaxID=1462606 RepID=K7MS96_SOYBN|nr:hypothetical protein GYH30_009958 [Glycine max]RZC16580.1 Protein HIRA [Glycine soja]
MMMGSATTFIDYDECWKLLQLRVANDYFPASNFSSSWCMGLIQSGELVALQVDVRKY